MAVVWVKEITEREGNYAFGDITATRSWHIKTDSDFDNSLTIGSAEIGSRLPSYLASHPSNLFLTCRSIRISNVQGRIWKATADYSAAPLTQDQKDRAEAPNPLDREVKVSWNTAEYTKVAVKDINEEGVVNSAGDYYDPPPEVSWERLSFNFRKNFESAPLWIFSYSNSVNAADIDILGVTIPAGQAKFSAPESSEELQENGQIYYEASWQIHCDPLQTWQIEVLDEGLRKKDGTDRVAIEDANGMPVTSPVLLDGSGGVLANPSLSNAVFTTHKVYTEKDYSTLPGVQSS